jgi:arylformamidase
MAVIDIEAEFDNRSRVPEHPEFFARWTREAAAFREAALAEGRAELGISYGPSPRQYLDLFQAPGTGPAPVALFIHGGYWRALDPSLFSQMAKGPGAHGFTVAVAGYDLCPQVTILEIVAQMRRACLTLWDRFKRPLFVYGHSAGGHLAGAMLATDWPALRADVPPHLVQAAYSISGLFDLAPLVQTSMNADLRLDLPEARRASPLYWPAPTGLTFDAVVGGDESNAFIEQSRIIAETWRQRGVETRYEAIAGANHFSVIDPLSNPDSAMTRRVVELAQAVKA